MSKPNYETESDKPVGKEKTSFVENAQSFKDKLAQAELRDNPRFATPMPETQDCPFEVVKHPKTEVKEMDESEDDCADIPDEQSMGQVTVKMIPDEPEEVKAAPLR